MMDKRTKRLHQENRILRFWFYNPHENEYVNDTHELMRALLKSDEFPRGNRMKKDILKDRKIILDYFSFIKRLMELLRIFSKLRKIELEIQTLDDNTLDQNHPSMLSFD